MNKIQKLISTFLCIILVSSVWFIHPQYTYCLDLNDMYKQQQQIEEKIKNTEYIMKQKEREKSKILSELNSLNKNLEKTSNDIENIEKNLLLTEKNIEKTEKEINTKEAELNERTLIFSKRLQQIYKQGNVNVLEVLFQSTSISDFLTRFELLKRIAKNDSSLLKALERERKILEDKKTHLETKKQELLTLKTTREQKRKQLQIASARRQNLIKEVEQQKDLYKKMLDELEKQSNLIAQEIRKLQSKDGQRPSLLKWPTPGYYRITSPYGWRIHPILKTNRLHTGVDIAAPYGSNIISSANGKVIFASWNGAYGHCIIVDHGGEMVTMYAHLSKYLVKVGDYVKQGQIIGKIGTSGWSTGPHLHFEVRINGDHVNPMPYLNK